MSPTSRRIFLYWLLLLVPTLVLGVVAVAWLRREEQRIAAQGANAVESRRAAVAARARLVVENLELLVGDVQNGLLDTLASTPARDLTALLDDWEKNNPMVRIGFVARPQGRLLRPEAGAAGDEARGFVRRFARGFEQFPPWREVVPTEPLEPATRNASAQEAQRSAITSNTLQVQSARRDVQELFKNRNYASAPGAAPSAARLPVAPGFGAAGADPRASATDDFLSRSAKIQGEPPFAPSDPGPGRRGWTARVVDGRMHLLAWVQPAATDDVRGVELEIAALISRLGAALPTDVNEGEGYVLQDEQGRVLHQAGLIPHAIAPVVRVPIANSLLPGWQVAGFLATAPVTGADGRAFFWLGLLLVAIFAAAILGGGSLLLWQARRSEAEAVQKTSFVANVSHEFKTPLTTIRLYSELLEQGRVPDEARRGEYLRTIGRETQRLARLVNNALDFSRLEQGRKKFTRETLDLRGLLAGLLDTHSPRVSEAGLRLDRALPSTAVNVTTDRDAVEQIVLNLVDNACKYAAAGGEVTVSLSDGAGAPTVGSRDGGAVIRVSDRGPGVPSDHRERIFEKFHRVDDTLTAEKSGAGLGLSIARQLARGLGGDLRYAPRAGGGAEFILELP